MVGEYMVNESFNDKYLSMGLELGDILQIINGLGSDYMNGFGYVVGELIFDYNIIEVITAILNGKTPDPFQIPRMIAGANTLLQII
jgi:hypothetical protein